MCTLPITGGGIMDYKANIPIYLQVIDDIKKRILTGEIKLGDKLPSTRELAVQYTVNPNTAARIYNELEQCGLCYTNILPGMKSMETPLTAVIFIYFLVTFLHK